MESALRAGGRDPELRLIETFAGHAGPARIGRHLERMARGAEALGWAFDREAAWALCSGAEGRLRLTLDCDGGLDLTLAPLPPELSEWRVGIAGLRLDPQDPWLRLKSTRRAVHDAARAGMAAGLDEVLLLNAEGEVCEGTITNLFFDRGQGLRTPPLSSGLLPGILRAELIEAGAREEVLLAKDLPAVRLWLGNSLRGLAPARLVGRSGPG